MKKLIGKTIADVVIDEHELTISMYDGSTIVFCDEGQQCCETRFMSCDDDLPYFSGAVYLGSEINDVAGPGGPGSGEIDHDIAFLVIHTSKGDFTVQNHNDHNGYYGGFDIEATVHVP